VERGGGWYVGWGGGARGGRARVEGGDWLMLLDVMMLLDKLMLLDVLMLLYKPILLHKPDLPGPRGSGLGGPA
jgi:hypothetical protein